MKIKISPAVIAYAVFLVATGRWYEGVSYFVALILHEAAHSAEAFRRGYRLTEIKLNVFGMSLKGDMDSMTCADEIAIAAAGPLASALFALCFTALWWIFPQTYFFSMEFVIANVCIVAFNMLPVYPLDGGRILVAALSKIHGRSSAYKRVRIIGFAISGVFLALFVVSLVFGFNPSFLFAAIFMLIGAAFPEKRCSYERLYMVAYRAQKLKRGLKVREIAISVDACVEGAEKLLNGDYYTNFVLIGSDMQPVAIVSETDVINAAANKREKLSALID